MNFNLIREDLKSSGRQAITAGGNHSLNSIEQINTPKDHIKEWLSGFYLTH